MTHVAGWPYRGLDVEVLRASGWRPTPFRDFVLKVHQRCNLACDYCYVYTHVDQTWRDRPPTMGVDIAEAAAIRIGDHVRRHRLNRINVILHGGEPLLVGKADLLRLIDVVRAAVPQPCVVGFSVQTNGVLLDEALLRTLRDSGVRIGVSLDGPPAGHDRRRPRPDGRGSFVAVDQALRLLATDEYRPAFAGLLCTVDPTIDPIGCYEALLSHAPPGIDFLLPHANWSRPPGRPPGTTPTPYGDWLVQVFDRWYDVTRVETRVGLFEEIINLLLGGTSLSEQVGLSPVAVAVVESDGAIEQVDSLKSTYPGACATGLNVLADSFEAALEHPGVVARQIGREALCDTCLDCPVHDICGAGHYAHRYRADTGFRNPSVYCADLRRLIWHIQHRVGTDLSRPGVGRAA